MQGKILSGREAFKAVPDGRPSTEYTQACVKASKAAAFPTSVSVGGCDVAVNANNVYIAQAYGHLTLTHDQFRTLCGWGLANVRATAGPGPGAGIGDLNPIPRG